ncbi:MAG: radical SAM protein [Salinivirgaceae bacterium]|jgi:MoaA/NifB/PqqE/SkfB family radical SAM enzyme|nr:radical SAM protein [Salinivirgaceae bacterium]
MTLAVIVDGIQFLKTLTAKKIINGLLLRTSYLISKISNNYIHWGTLESLSIEPTNLCNLKCPECPSGNNKMLRPRLFISENNFDHTIRQVSECLTYLQLFFQGEPLMHPKIYNYIKKSTTKKIYTSISTNGQFLSLENSTKIVQSGLHRIIVSIDGATQQVYEKYRVGGDLTLAKNGIKNLIAERKRLKSKTPYIIMQFVVLAYNEHQITEIKALAQTLNADKLQLKSAQISDTKEKASLVPKKAKYSRYIKNSDGNFSLKRNRKFKCKRVWFGSVISANNELLPCCFDKDANHSYAELSKVDIKYAWKGILAKDFRIKVWNNHNSIDICKNCSEGLWRKP